MFANKAFSSIDLIYYTHLKLFFEEKKDEHTQTGKSNFGSNCEILINCFLILCNEILKKFMRIFKGSTFHPYLMVSKTIFNSFLQQCHTEKKTWYCGQASCSLFTNFFGKKVTTNFSLSKLQTKFIDNRLNR